jgi:uncharacterized protein YjlB
MQNSVSLYPTSELKPFKKELIRLSFGGEANLLRFEASVYGGDVIIVPAGVGYRLLDDFNCDFEMVGSYPRGKSWEICYGKQGEEKVKGIARLGRFEKDPLYRDDGPVLKL